MIPWKSFYPVFSEILLNRHTRDAPKRNMCNQNTAFHSLFFHQLLSEYV